MLYIHSEQKLLPLLADNKKIGLFASGGFDSTLLLFVCLTIYQQHRLPLNLRIFTVPRHDDSIAHASRIVNFFNEQFNTSLEISTVGNPNLSHEQQVLSGVMQARDLCDHLLIGDTSNPTHLPNGPARVRSMSPRFVQPFFDWTKKQTVQLAHELGQLEKIAELTHTCTESSSIRCGQCWQCLERAWGFSQNNLADNGTM
jgi:hypothetical protein